MADGVDHPPETDARCATCRRPKGEQRLNDEGLIRVKSIQEFDGGYAFNGVQLTSRGIAIIQAKPKDPDLGESIEKKLSEPGDTDAATYTKIGAFVGGVIAAGIQTLAG